MATAVASALAAIGLLCTQIPTPASADGTPPTEAIVLLLVWMVCALTCLVSVPCALVGLWKDKSRRTLGHWVIVSAGTLLLLAAIAYLIDGLTPS